MNGRKRKEAANFSGLSSFRSLPFLLFLSLACLGASPAMAWGPLGHKIVGLIAQRRLTAQARASVRALLGPGVTLDKIANCADTVKYATAPFLCAGVFSMNPKDFKGTAIWHFIDIPLAAHPTAGQLMQWCPQGNCVTAQTRKDADILSDPGAPIAVKRVALMFAVHFVGDLHQPLHCEDDHDQGGNKKQVVFMGVRKRLHELWDDMILPENWRVTSRENPMPWVRLLEKDITRRKSAAWTFGDWVDDAALESHAISRDVIYPQYAKDHGRNLGRAYQKEMQPIVRLRLEMAGVRLAYLLNRAFAAAPLGRTPVKTAAKR